MVLSANSIVSKITKIEGPIKKMLDENLNINTTA